jgi:nitrite transporter NirC
MPIPIPDALSEQVMEARKKATSLRSPGKYLVSGALAGAYIGVGVVLIIMATGPLNAANAPATKLVQGLVFGIALTLVIFAGSELSTGNMMTMVHGLFDKARGVGFGAAIAVIAVSFAANFLGAAVFAWLIHNSGILSITTPGHPAPGQALLTSMIATKSSESDQALFFRGVLCNFLVCLAVWTGVRTRSDGAKLALIFWCLLAFICSGFEHVGANMDIYWMGILQHLPQATWTNFGRNLLFSGLGNLIGGGLLVGVTYGILGRTGSPTPSVPDGLAPAVVSPNGGAYAGTH